MSEPRAPYDAGKVKAVEWVNLTLPLSSIKPWEHNPKSISKSHAKRLLAYWDKIGQFQTLAIGPDGELYDGHQRYAVLLAAHGDQYRVDVRQASRALTDDERRELTIAAHTGTVGQFNWDELANWDAGSLQDWGMDAELLKDWKADAGALSNMLEAAKPHVDAEPQIDRAAELLEKWQVKTGDLWRIGEHRLLCGDSTKREDVERVMDIQPGMMVTDPPYGVEYDPEWRLEAGVADVVHGHQLQNDDRADWTETWALFPGDVVYIWHAGAKTLIVANSLENNGFVLLYLIIWNKDLAVFGRGDYHHKHEPCWYAVRKGHNHHFVGDSKQKTVWDIPTIHSFANGHNSEEWGLVGHGTQKPVECMMRPIKNHDFEIIYDPFLGSGTTLVACQNLSRKCRAIEISPAYCAVTLERMATAFPGIEIERIDSLQT